MTPLNVDRKLNSDGSLRAQREPSIATDRRGNLTVVWSDSASSSWDVTGQVLDNTGMLQGSNFRVNTYGDSAQLHPDITLDGRYRFVTWVDKRNGNYDIYASITQYNDPNLIPEPSALRFEMEAGGPLPAAQTIVISHAGYNPLNYGVSVSHDWLSVDPSSGSTPDTLTVTINTDTLPYGTHFGALTLIDTDFDDSTVVVSIRLDVTAPILALSDDTLSFQAFALIDETYQQLLIIENDGSGEFSWQATETASWLTLSENSGTAPDTVAVAVNAASLTTGNYVEAIIFEAAGAVGSPDTVEVVLEVVDNLPYLKPEPDSFYVQTGSPETIDTFIIVQNEGVGLLNWSATVTDSWLRADRLSGGAGDTIKLTVDTVGLERALYTATVEITDSAAFNIAVSVPFILNFADSDTVLFNSVNVDSGTTSIVPVELTLVNSMAALSLPVGFDPTAVMVDSVIFNPTLPAYFDKTARIDNVAGNIFIDLIRNGADSVLGPGHYLLVEIHFTADGHTGSSAIDTLISDSSVVYVLNDRNQQVTPAVIPGTINIDIPTAVDDGLPDGLPGKIALMQNYPNPFNITTNINFELPLKTFVQLEVYNILGQKVNTLIEQELSAGTYSVIWDGNFDSGRVAASGIYFYRLMTVSNSLVRKMVLVK
ncbi:MAG: T9SS type A sorting domain-containing protein [candidate division Zixibacteria bacterium]|nr:T9SS type A sorting domain-containing protein [candidate division Zixibacteria bacterium]